MTKPTGTDLRFERDGAQFFRSAIEDGTCIAIEDALAELAVDKAGVRIGSAPALRRILAADGSVGSIAATTIGPLARPVRAVLFDKTPATNWSPGSGPGLRPVEGKGRVDAERGDVWLYATTVLHGSRAANPPRRRRVLQVHNASEDLPVPLRWVHI